MDETTRTQRFEAHREAFRAGVSFAIAGLKTLALINGAAAIALLTFVANVSQQGRALDGTAIRLALWAFMLGTVAAVAASLAAFVAQARLGRLADSPDPMQDKWLKLYRLVTFVIAGTALLAFVLGGYWAAETFGRLT